MKIALGHLRMRPDDFWRMTLPEFFAATEGYMESKGGGVANSIAPLTQDEVEGMFSNLNNESNS